MRKIYLIRHGKPDIPEGMRICLGSTDLPLGSFGRLQAAVAGAALKDAGLTAVFCSRLARSRQTAELIGVPLIEVPGLEEMDAGEWDGLDFNEIRERWPELYALRGRDMSVSPPGAESREEGRKRFISAVSHALAASEGSIAIVAHASVMQTLLCTALELPLDDARSIRLPYGSVSLLTYEGGEFSVRDIGTLPRPAPDAEFCTRLQNAAMPPNIAAHCRAVAAEAMRIARELSSSGFETDEDLIRAGAMLHDICRLEENHAAAGAGRLRALGYSRIADVIRQHHGLDDASLTDEAALVFIADKLVEGSERVTLNERFGKSREKCFDEEARKAHLERYEEALSVAGRINLICGKEIII